MPSPLSAPVQRLTVAAGRPAVEHAQYQRRDPPLSQLDDEIPRPIELRQGAHQPPRHVGIIGRESGCGAYARRYT
ncbi:MAG: hypothetical protein ACJ8AW_45385 [Rhodopila sp.]